MSGRAAFNLALLAILGMYLAACWFVHPIADDFVFARDARAGLWTAWLSEYAGFSGRYASNALVLSGPAAWGAAGYRAAAALMLIGVPAAAYAFVRAWFTDTLSRSEALACALVFSALYVSQMPSTGEGIYWYTAAATHHAPLVLVLLHLALVLRSLRGGRGGRIYLFAAFVLLVAVAGFNEVMTLLLLGFYAAWTVWSAGDRAGGSGSRVPGILLAVTAACAVAVVMSPGNTVRQGLYAAVHHRLLYSAGMTVLQTLRFSVDWVSSGALLFATVLFVPIGREVGANAGASAFASPMAADLAGRRAAGRNTGGGLPGLLGDRNPRAAPDRQHCLFRVPRVVVHRHGCLGGRRRQTRPCGSPLQ